MNNFHRFQNFRQFSNLLSQIWLKKRHTSFFSWICRETQTKFHKQFAEKCKIWRQQMKKSEIHCSFAKICWRFLADILRSERCKISSRAFQRVFPCKHRRRYSRERASQSLEGIWKCGGGENPAQIPKAVEFLLEYLKLKREPWPASSSHPSCPAPRQGRPPPTSAGVHFLNFILTFFNFGLLVTVGKLCEAR